VYEQDILREPASVKPWLAYIEFKTRHGSILEQAYVMERACAQLPRSYKLWKLVGSPNRVHEGIMLMFHSTFASGFNTSQH
jgi:pre-mRNA-splicing factor SYF1